jgi:hypothetical protein
MAAGMFARWDQEPWQITLRKRETCRILGLREHHDRLSAESSSAASSGSIEGRDAWWAPKAKREESGTRSENRVAFCVLRHWEVKDGTPAYVSAICPQSTAAQQGRPCRVLSCQRRSNFRGAMAESTGHCDRPAVLALKRLVLVRSCQIHGCWGVFD